MTIAYFQTLSLPQSAGGDAVSDIRRDYCGEVIPELLRQKEISGVSLFSPAPIHDPYVDDGMPPGLVIQINLTDKAALSKLFETATTRLVLSSPAGALLGHDVFDVISFGLAQGQDAPPRTAPVSYNVRYYSPIENPDTFVSHYLDHHVPILKRLPDVRNVLCYVPIAWDHPPELQKSGCILGNEVVFESFQSLNAALASDVRHTLREDFEAFPVKPGPHTHYAMSREDFSPPHGAPFGA